MENQNSNGLKSFLFIIFIFIVFASIIFGYFYFINNQQKAPYNRTVKINDTDTYIETSYNDKYDITRLDITIDEIIEDWQIKAIGNDKTDIKLECETQDKTVKKEYDFKDIPLNKGEKIKGNLIFENSTIKDYAMLKDLLNGKINIEIFQQYLSLDTKERDNLQQKYYNKEQVTKETPIRRNRPSSFFDTLFDF